MLRLCTYYFLVAIQVNMCLSEQWPSRIKQWAIPILTWSQYYNINPNWIAGIIDMESAGINGDTDKLGVGLMGVLPSDQNDNFPNRRKTVELLDPNLNIADGTFIFKTILDRNNGNIRLSLALYNCSYNSLKHNKCASFGGWNYVNKMISRMIKLGVYPFDNSKYYRIEELP